MSEIKVSLDGLADAIITELEKYSQEASEELKKELKNVAKEGAKELKGTSPKKSGEYAKGWTPKTVYESNDDIRITIHNKKKPGLTHLLEHGHAKVGGGRVPARPHISSVEEKMIEDAIKAAEKAYGK